MRCTTRKKLVRSIAVAVMGTAAAVFGNLPCKADGFGSVRVPTPQIPQIRMGGGFQGGHSVVVSPPTYPQTRFGSPRLGHLPTYVPHNPMGGQRTPFFPQPAPSFHPYGPGMGLGSPGYRVNPRQPVYAHGYNGKPPRISMDDVRREGGNAGGVASDIGQPIFQGFFGGTMNGQGGGQNKIYHDEGASGEEKINDESAYTPAEVTGGFLQPGQISRPHIKVPRIRLPW